MLNVSTVGRSSALVIVINLSYFSHSVLVTVLVTVQVFHFCSGSRDTKVAALSRVPLLCAADVRVFAGVSPSAGGSWKKETMAARLLYVYVYVYAKTDAHLLQHYVVCIPTHTYVCDVGVLFLYYDFAFVTVYFCQSDVRTAEGARICTIVL
jgi:hypothetical protein